MMGSAGIIDPANTCHPQNVPSRVSDWLQSNTRDYYPAAKEYSWPSKYKIKKDPDQHSITSIDDTVSVSDSGHESCSSDSSNHTYSTTATDLADFLDDEDPEHSQVKIPFLESLSSRQSEEACMLESNRRYAHKLKRARDGLDGQQPPSNLQYQPAENDDLSRHRIQKCNSRRTSCSKKKPSPPCKLLRDTDGTDHFVTLLIIFATKLITAIWPLSACPPMMSTCFNGAGVLPLQVFIQETLKRSRASYSTLQVALYYLILLKARSPEGHFAQEQHSNGIRGESQERRQCRAMQCGRRMFLSALMLASKYLQDRNYSARAWSKISGLRSNEINDNEREYLRLIDYSLHVPKDSFDNWSKIVICLSKLCSKSRKPSLCRSGAMETDSSRPGGGMGNALADMVPSLHLDEPDDQELFSDEWWTDIIRSIDPAVVKDPTQTEDFLATHVPGYRGIMVDLYKSWHCDSSPELDSSPPAMDINLCESLKSRVTEASKFQSPQTPQTPSQLSPARSLKMPIPPQLGNLPTPQTTPRLAEGCPMAMPSSRPALRCSASLDALRNMRRQTVRNAIFDRCPPPKQPTYGPLPVRSLMRPAETIQELPSRSTTPSVFSPASTTSTASDATSCTSRSRSSSISSSSSWSTCSSTLPRIRAPAGSQFSSPLARVSSLSGRPCGTLNSTKKVPDTVVTRFNDEGYGSGEEPLARFGRNPMSRGPDLDAAQVLMSLSSYPETSSQSVTPTPQNFSTPDQEIAQRMPRGHKRTLSKTDCLHLLVRNSLLDQDASSVEVVEDELPSCYDMTPKQWQQGTKCWAAPRRALPNRLDSKRTALYCAEQNASAPELAAHSLRHCVSLTAS